MAQTKEIKTISVAGKTYAVGLFWQPVQVEKDYLKEVKAAVQTVVIGADLYCFKKGAASQYGLGYSSLGQKKGMPAGASGIATALRDKSSAVCAFKLNEGWWFITIRNNLILSEEDTVYTEEADAKEAFNSMLSIPDWGYKIAPAEWAIEDTKEIAAAELLAKGQPVELKSIEGPGLKWVVILAMCAGAYWYYDKMQKDKIAEQKRIIEQRKRAELLAQGKKDEIPEALLPPPAPWESLTDTTDMAKKCAILIINSTATVPGWELSDSVCVERQMTSQWKRTYGTAGWIFDAQRFGMLSGKIALKAKDTSYNNVAGTVAIPMMKHLKSEPNIQKTTLQKKLRDIFQSLNVASSKLSDGNTVIKDPKNPSYTKEYPFTEFSFTDVAFRLPLDWVKLLAGINSIEFTSIKWDNTNRKWTYEGKIYEKTE
jgi:hypothetical protein